MSLNSDQRQVLATMLGLTQDIELDCDAFLTHLAAHVDGGITDSGLELLMAHHKALCGECAEAYTLLKRCLGESGPAEE